MILHAQCASSSQMLDEASKPLGLALNLACRYLFGTPCSQELAQDWQFWSTMLPLPHDQTSLCRIRHDNRRWRPLGNWPLNTDSACTTGAPRNCAVSGFHAMKQSNWLHKPNSRTSPAVAPT